MHLMQGPTEFTETLNRITIISLAITIKTRGIAEVEHMIYLQPLLEQIMATSQHTWSEKTLRYFPPLIRDFLMGRMDKRGQAIQAWQQVSFSYGALAFLPLFQSEMVILTLVFDCANLPLLFENKGTVCPCSVKTS